METKKNIVTEYRELLQNIKEYGIESYLAYFNEFMPCIDSYLSSKNGHNIFMELMMGETLESILKRSSAAKNYLLDHPVLLKEDEMRGRNAARKQLENLIKYTSENIASINSFIDNACTLEGLGVEHIVFGNPADLDGYRFGITYRKEVPREDFTYVTKAISDGKITYSTPFTRRNIYDPIIRKEVYVNVENPTWTIVANNFSNGDFSLTAHIENFGFNPIREDQIDGLYDAEEPLSLQLFRQNK